MQKHSGGPLEKAQESGALSQDDGPAASTAQTTSFPIVGLGASAGGLDALRQILVNLPDDTGMAFVVIQHLDPGRPSMLASVLSAHTRMPVVEIAGDMPVEPNRVHVIPSSSDITVRECAFALLPREPMGKLHLPIDIFFRALAEDQPGRAVGVVLSGLGSDGTEGLRAIMDAGGITFAQDPESAQFRSMPESALAARAVDFRLTPEKIAGELVRLSQHPYLTRAEAFQGSAERVGTEDPGSLATVIALLRLHTQSDFSGYKRPTLLRRIARRMALRHITAMGEYADCLREDPREARDLAQDILIHVTSFFRDPASFQTLTASVFPEILRDKEDGSVIRLWIAGCASGEEAYSIAICLLEYLASQGRNVGVKLFGSDLSGPAIETARAAVYPESKLLGVSADRLSHFFDPVEGGYCISKRVRDCCVFVKHDLTRDPPFGKLDLISCRNVLIYFDTELQRRVLPMLHYCLNKSAYLFLGASEALTGFADLFAPFDKAGRLYQKLGENRRIDYPLAVGRAPVAPLAAQATPGRRQPAREAERQGDHYLLARYAPPGGVINSRLEIIQYRGRTGAFLESPPGQPQHNLIRMARAGLVGPLSDAIELAKARGEAVRKEGLQLPSDGTHASPQGVHLEVVPLPNLSEPGERYFLVLFEPIAAALPVPVAVAVPVPPSLLVPVRSSDERNGLGAELAATRGFLEALLSEHQSTTDELAAVNEELVAANEEFQCTNEELQGTQEELQSTNEELSTVNDELRSRNHALDQTASDLVNILESVKIPIIIVDGEMRIRRFTPTARVVSNLIAADVGRLIEDVKFKVKIEDLAEKIRETLESLTPKEWELQGLDERWLRMQIRPYRGTDNRLDGVLLSFIDEDVLKRALQAAEIARDYARGIVESVETALVVLDPELRVLSANRAFYEHFRSSPSVAEGALFFELAAGGWQEASVRAAIEKSLATRVPFRDLEVQREFPGLGRKSLMLGGRPLLGEGGSSTLLLAIEDITERRLYEAERAQLLSSAQQARAEGERANRAKDLFLATLSHELRTPLSTILSSTQLLKLAATADPMIQRTSALIERAVRAQARLIEDLLDISRIVSGKLILDLQAVDLATVLRSAVDGARSAADAKEILLAVTIGDALGPVYGDPGRLQQVFANLLINAIKFTPRGGKVGVSLVAHDGSAQICVTDSGMGISAELLPKLFDRFVQAESAKTQAYGGLGLGLAIVKHLVEVHGGEVVAESPGVGYGATFRVRLPFSAQTPTSPSIASAISAVSRDITGIRVLLIDDEEDTRESCSTMLGALGAHVKSVGSAMEGLATVQSWRPQVILCDIAMPGEDGYGFIGKLRALLQDQGGQTPAAALTALAGSEDHKRTLGSGFQMHLVKPIGSARLAAAIATLADWAQPLLDLAPAPADPLLASTLLHGE